MPHGFNIFKGLFKKQTKKSKENMCQRLLCAPQNLSGPLLKKYDDTCSKVSAVYIVVASLKLIGLVGGLYWYWA